MEKDNERDTYLKRNGFRILRFWNNEVFTNIDGVLEVISVNCLKSPSPNPWFIFVKCFFMTLIYGGLK